MLTRIHINQHNVKANKKDGENRPVITVKNYKQNRYCHAVKILGESTVMYQPENPLSCGAHAWIETEAEVALYVRVK